MKYKIEKNVPVPDNIGRRGQPPKYPFGDMEVGDSIVAKRLGRQAAYVYGWRNKKKFVSKIEKRLRPGFVSNNDLFRIWRVK